MSTEKSTTDPAPPGVARLFVGVTPPEDVCEVIAEVPRPELTGLRWTDPAQWHVTLRFLGSASVREAREALGGLDHPPVRAVIGPEIVRLGPRVLCVEVDGLAGLAAAVRECTSEVGERPEPRPFVGHLTLARLGGEDRARRDPLGSPIAAASWLVEHVELLRSRRGPAGATYEAVGGVALGRS